jgi:hypothetical protein
MSGLALRQRFRPKPATHRRANALEAKSFQANGTSIVGPVVFESILRAGPGVRDHAWRSTAPRPLACRPACLDMNIGPS